MNKIFLYGNLTVDPELRTSNGKSYCRFSLAVNDSYGEEERTDFFNVIAFGARGEAIARNLKKGRKLLVEGRVKVGSYTNDKGETRKTFDVILADFRFVPDGKGKQEQSDYAEEAQQADQKVEEPSLPNNTTSVKPSDDLPF